MKYSFLHVFVAFAVNIGFIATFKLLRAKRSTDVPSRCLQPPLSGPCRALFFNFYYNPSSGECETFAYGGCQGNENNFWDVRDCEAVCKDIDRNEDNDFELWESMEALVESKDDCEYPPETGDCRALFHRYYFNGEKCEMFIYGGCGANPNNFRTEEECMEKCGPKSENEGQENEGQENEGQENEGQENTV